MVNADILKYSAADPVGQVNPVVLWKDAIRNSLQWNGNVTAKILFYLHFPSCICVTG